MKTVYLHYDYKTRPYQEAFHNAIGRYKIICLIGGVRTGKTWAGAMETLRLSVKAKLSLVVAPTLDLLTPARRMLLEHCPPSLFHKYLKETGELYLRSGSVIKLRSAQYPDRLRGLRIDGVIWLDEIAQSSRDILDICLARVLDTDAPILITTTPMGKNWLYDLMTQRRPDVCFIHAKTSQNPSISHSALLSLRKKYTGRFARQELDGEFVAFEGLVYDVFDPLHHSFNRLPLSDTPPVLVGALDKGFGEALSVYLLCARLGTSFYILDEIVETSILDEVLIRRIKPLEQHWTSELGVPVSRRWADPHIQLATFSLHQLPFIPARDALVEGIQSVYSLFSNKKLFISPRCHQLKKELGLYRYATPRSSGIVARPIDRHNDALDALRYLIFNELPIARKPISEQKELSEEDRIVMEDVKDHITMEDELVIEQLLQEGY